MKDYKGNESVRQFIGMLDGLAFLPLADVDAGMALLRANVPQVDGVQDVVDYFDATYVSGGMRVPQGPVTAQPALRLRRTPPLFPPEFWNMHEATINGDERTNNACEGWNNAFSHLVGQDHPPLWTVIEAFQMDEAMVATDIVENARGQPPQRNVNRNLVGLQTRLLNLCRNRRDNVATVAETLSGLGRVVRRLRKH